MPDLLHDAGGIAGRWRRPDFCAKYLATFIDLARVARLARTVHLLHRR
jgi:hypothetical protein